jgi:hypothetical protein
MMNSKLKVDGRPFKPFLAPQLKDSAAILYHIINKFGGNILFISSITKHKQSNRPYLKLCPFPSIRDSLEIPVNKVGRVDFHAGLTNLEEKGMIVVDYLLGRTVLDGLDR